MAKIACVNIKHPDFIKLKEVSNLGSLELEVAVSDWQTANSTDAFPTLEQLEVSEQKAPISIDNTKENLLAALNRNGITVTSMKEYEENYGIRNGEELNITALADTTRKIIAAIDTDNIESLNEEAGHMIVASQVGTGAFNRAMRLVENTNEYKDNYDKYSKAYRAQGLTGEALDRKVRMEMLGKLMKTSLFNNFKQSTQGTGILRYLRRMWNSFIKLFKAAKPEIENIVDKWASTFVSGVLPDVQDEGTFYELEDEVLSKGEKLFKKLADNLRNKYKFYERIGKPEVSENLKDFYWEIYDLEYKEGIMKLLKFASDDVKRGAKGIQGFKKNPDSFTSEHYRDMKLMIQYYRTTVDQLKDYFDPIVDEDTNLTAEDKKKAKKVFKKINDRLNSIEVFHRAMGERLGQQWAKEHVDNTITDPNVKEQEKKQIEENLREVDFDSNKALYWFGSLAHAKDPIQRILHYAVTKIKRAVNRFTYDLGQSLIKKSEELGIKDIARLAEKDADGKSTGYFINRHRLGEWNKAKDKFHEELHERMGVPQDKKERNLIKRQWYDAQDRVEDALLSGRNPSQEDLDMVATMTKYNTEVAQWYATNSVPTKNWSDRIEQVKKELGGGDTAAFKAWKKENVGVAKKGTKWEYEYPKGELSEPSDGRTVTKKYGRGGATEFSTKTKDWRNPEYDKLSENEVAYLNTLIDTVNEANQKSARTKKRHRLLLPQVKGSTADLVKAKKFSNIVENIKDIARTAEDDTEFGDREKMVRPDGSVAQFVPIYFDRMLDNTDNISLDLTSTVIMYADVMENYDKMSKAYPTFEMVLDNIGARTVTNGREQYTGIESETYKTMHKFIEMNVLGQMKKSWIVGGVNITKLMQGLVKFVTANNLAFSLYTTLASYFTSATYSKIEDLVGEHTNQKNKVFAEKIWDTNIHHVLSESGKKVKTSKLGMFFEHHRVIKNNRDIFNNLDKSRLTRKALESGLYWSYELVKLRIRGKLALAIADNYKYHNGKFHTVNELKNLGVDYEALPNYWDMMEVKDGKLVAMHNDPTIEDRIEAKIDYIGANIDGELNYTDWAAAHQGALTQLVTTHRGWLFRNVQLRLKSKNPNYQTGEMEGGFYVEFADFMKSTFFGEERVKSLKGLLARWETLTPAEKHGVMRTIWEIAFLWGISTLALILNNIAADDDEDDSLIQYLAYQSNRVLLELGAMNPVPVFAFDPSDDNWIAFRPPFLSNVQELVSILNSPVAAARQVDDLMDITNIFSGEELKSGPYEGMTKRKRLLVKMIPGLKGYYQAKDPKSRNQFLKLKTLTWLTE